jgi:hypothetical protein
MFQLKMISHNQAPTTRIQKGENFTAVFQVRDLNLSISFVSFMLYDAFNL